MTFSWLVWLSFYVGWVILVCPSQLGDGTTTDRFTLVDMVGFQGTGKKGHQQHVSLRGQISEVKQGGP